MPKIQDIMNWRGKYKYFTKIDLSMFFYCFELDDESKELCMINTPYGLFRYTRLAMGVKVSPDVAQEMIIKILNGLNVECYIDDCGAWTNSTFKEHMQLVDKILKRLANSRIECNPLKSDWGERSCCSIEYAKTNEQEGSSIIYRHS